LVQTQCKSVPSKFGPDKGVSLQEGEGGWPTRGGEGSGLAVSDKLIQAGVKGRLNPSYLTTAR